MKVASITKHITFDAAHYLINDQWTKEENMKNFHKCCLYKEDGSEEAHGHTYHLEVTIIGEIDKNNGYVVDFKELKKILKDGVVERLDHRLINNIPWFKENNALCTVENIMHYVWEEIQPQIDELRPGKAWLDNIKMWETPNSYATYTRQMWVHEQHRNTCDPEKGCGGGGCCSGKGEKNA